MTFFEYSSYSKFFAEEDKRQWWHTSSLLALHANLNRDQKKNPSPYKAESFHPYEGKKKKAKFVRGMSQAERDLTMQWAQKLQDKNG
tara:strand:+ start:3818 stop:4078 length:261 start_codon:yes stop_codon:yes gene_type:complete